jgi:hypothetical protein
VDPPAFGERVEFAREAAGVRGAVEILVDELVRDSSDLVGDVR